MSEGRYIVVLNAKWKDVTIDLYSQHWSEIYCIVLRMKSFFARGFAVAIRQLQWKNEQYAESKFQMQIIALRATRCSLLHTEALGVIEKTAKKCITFGKEMSQRYQSIAVNFVQYFACCSMNLAKRKIICFDCSFELTVCQFLKKKLLICKVLPWFAHSKRITLYLWPIDGACSNKE